MTATALPPRPEAMSAQLSVSSSSVPPPSAGQVPVVSVVASSAIESLEDPEYEALPDTAGPMAHLVAGAIAGIAEHTLMYPLDAIKTRLQILVPGAPQAQYAGTTHALARISATEGLHTLWRGVSSVVVGAGPAHALYFASYEYCKAMALRVSHGSSSSGGPQSITPVWAGAAGAVATVVQDVIMNPFDVIKQRMQSYAGKQYHSMVHCARTLMHNEGFRAFYVSYPTTLSMSIPFQSVHFATYEAMANYLNPTHQYDPVVHMVSGACAGAAAAAVTTPLDVAKTLLQTQGESPDPQIRSARGMRDAIRLVYARGGLAAFFKGLVPRVASHIPATAVCWTTYEYFKWFLCDTADQDRLCRPVSASHSANASGTRASSVDSTSPMSAASQVA